jgi:hypothetical protein
VSDYQRRVVETLTRARFASSEAERARLFSIAEEWSARARQLERLLNPRPAERVGTN